MDTMLVLRIRLEDDGRSLTGTLEGRDTSTSFTGWLGLFAALDGLLVGPGQNHQEWPSISGEAPPREFGGGV
jgi:hypothetical protein